MKDIVIKRILQQNKDLYNGVADDFSNTRNYIWPGLDKFSKLVKDGDRVLDLGCGNGRLANLFKGCDVKYLGVDFSKELIKIAKEKFKNSNNVEFEVGDLLTYKSDNRFDLILTIATLHHIPTRKKQIRVLKNIFDNLEKGGRVVLVNWNFLQYYHQFKYLKYLLDYSQKINQGVWGWRDGFLPFNKPQNKNLLRFVHSFGKRELTKMLKQVGFEIEEIYFEKDGKKTNVFAGRNLVAIVHKK